MICYPKIKSFLTSTRAGARAKVNDFAILKFEETFYIDERGVENNSNIRIIQTVKSVAFRYYRIV